MKLSTLSSYLVSLLTPLALLGLALRVLLTPLFYTIEYRLPYFPADEYGFTTADRLHWAPYAVNYLVNRADISYLGDLKFEGGLPLYNERELSHMHDVKNVITGALRIWYVSVAVLILLLISSYRHRWHTEYLQGLQRGGAWMVGLALALGFIAGAGILFNPNLFWDFFAGFHAIFFTGDSWLFYYSDTLIRLFPMRFWQDAVIALAAIALGGGFGLAFGLRKYLS